MQLFGRYSLCILYETYALECRDPESFIVCSYLVDTVCVSFMRRMLIHYGDALTSTSLLLYKRRG